jgi:hypothetical protein
MASVRPSVTDGAAAPTPLTVVAGREVVRGRGRLLIPRGLAYINLTDLDGDTVIAEVAVADGETPSGSRATTCSPITAREPSRLSRS